MRWKIGCAAGAVVLVLMGMVHGQTAPAAGEGGGAKGAGPATASAPASRPATGAASRARTVTMEFQFQNAEIDTVLDEMAARLGFVIERTVKLNGRISVRAPAPVNSDEAIVLLNTMIVPLGYGAVEKPAQEQADGRKARVLRVMPWDQAKKESPVRR
jgi:hypothetical protein